MQDGLKHHFTLAFKSFV